MYPHHEKVFKYLASQNMRVGELVLSEGIAKVLFCSHQYGDKRLFEVWKNLPHFFGESVNIELCSEGLFVTLPNYNDFTEDETTEVVNESGSSISGTTRELKVPEAGDVATHSAKPTSERFGFIL